MVQCQLCYGSGKRGTHGDLSRNCIKCNGAGYLRADVGMPVEGVPGTVPPMGPPGTVPPQMGPPGTVPPQMGPPSAVPPQMGPPAYIPPSV